MFYIIDKPLWLTSYDVIRKLKKILSEKRIGHTGTLDPLATGILVIATGKSTKLIPYLEHRKKRYRFSVDISGYTESLDLGTERESAGEITIDHTPTELRDFLQSLTHQVPPIYSALRIWGKRAYEYARSGIEIEMRERPIQISDCLIHRFDPPFFDIELTISSGGYIRSLARTIGEFFGTNGGYIQSLRRISIDGITDIDSEYCQKLDLFNTHKSVPYSLLFPDWEVLSIDESLYQDLKNGKNIPAEAVCQRENWQKIILKYEDIFESLVEYRGKSYRVIKNDIGSSH